jgi:hypothetical protein
VSCGTATAKGRLPFCRFPSVASLLISGVPKSHDPDALRKDRNTQFEKAYI